MKTDLELDGLLAELRGIEDMTGADRKRRFIEVCGDLTAEELQRIGQLSTAKGETAKKEAEFFEEVQRQRASRDGKL